ncbi:AraC family transcriptional regulator [Chondromyces apiculatus]|uniref:Transcriptional regulator, AraC family n=1 Tax=Chondromyces apiculatus DSM 436 TaxID=1192034 RepID=A0A017T936_9BACT|nr:AraC family transcriptional regulator [Chondromyces apiculatus]EYF05330.1 Transcriptional regulator, AraC family [Chondromyces apiculatus DSM 436]
MFVDPFSGILDLVKARAVLSGGLEASGRWALRFPPPDKIKFFVVARGACWLAIDGGETVQLQTGDVVMLAAPRGFVMASDLVVPPLDALAAYENGTRRMFRFGEGDEFLFVGGHVQLDAASARLLVDHLPPSLHLCAGRSEAAMLGWLIQQLVQEHFSKHPGSEFAAAQLAQLMFLQLLRVHLATAGALPAGRLRAMSDPKIAPALRLMHGTPSRAWHLAELAKAAGMSRTAFAVYFKAVAGVAPLAYLTEWRMRLAEQALRESDRSVAELAEALGYASESAFSTAFKRVVGSAPRRYRAGARGAAESLAG